MHSQTLVTVILGVLELIYFSVMSRLLTQKDFGFFALITAVTVVLTSLTDAGFGSSVIQKKNINEDFKSTAFSLSLISGFLFSLILFFGAPLFSDLMVDSDELTKAFRIMSVIMLLQGITNIHNALFIKKLHFLKIGLIRAAGYTGSSIVGIVLALRGFGFYAIVWANVAYQLLFTISLLLVTRKQHLTLSISKQYVKQIFSFGGWLTATVIIRNITDQVDKFIVARMLSVTIVGAINRPNGFINTISSKINGIFDTILFPILSNIQDNKRALLSAFEKAIALIIVCSSFICGVIILGSYYIIDIFFGNEWFNIERILWILGLYILFSGLSRIQDCFFRSLGIMKSYFIARLSNCIVAIGFVFAGCYYGIIGVAFAILLRNVANVIIKYFMLKPYIGFNHFIFLKTIFRNVWFSLLIGIGLFIFMYFFPLTEYYMVFIYISVIGFSIIFFPRIFGEMFAEQIATRYIKPICNKLHIKCASL